MRRLSQRVGAALMRPAPLALAGVLALAGMSALVGVLPMPGVTPSASALPPSPPGEPTTPQTDASVPANEVTMIGATPEEPGAPGRDETWGLGSVGQSGQTKALVRYYLHSGPRGEEGTWTLGPSLPAGFQPEGEAPLFGEMTPRGAGLLAGEVEKRQILLIRSPGGSFPKKLNPWLWRRTAKNRPGKKVKNQLCRKTKSCSALPGRL